MKRSNLLLALFYGFHLSLFSQQEIISKATEFIVTKKYDSANAYLDSLLKKNSENVDALMMKGNVILNRAMDNLPAANTITKNDESIFYSAIEPKEAQILPADTVYLIEKFWRKCLLIDSSRNDFRKGLCTVYAMALMKKELKKEMMALKNLEKNEDGQQGYRMAEYARKFKERGEFDNAMEVYQFVATMFPELAGLRCDIANEYFYEANLKETLRWLDSCYNFKTIDETSFLNGAFTYSELGYFDNAQNVLNVYSNIYQRKMGQFYSGLKLFSDSSPKYWNALNSFIQSIDTNAYSNEVYVAQKLLTYRDSFRINDLTTLASDPNIPDYYRVLILARGVKQFSNNCELLVTYGVYQSSIKNYSAAVQFLEDGDRCGQKAEQKEYWMMNYGYALFMSGEEEKSLLYFRALYSSTNPVSQNASKYFSAKIWFKLKQNEAAKKLMEEIVSSKEETKYVALAKQLMK